MEKNDLVKCFFDDVEGVYREITHHIVRWNESNKGIDDATYYDFPDVVLTYAIGKLRVILQTYSEFGGFEKKAKYELGEVYDELPF